MGSAVTPRTSATASSSTGAAVSIRRTHTVWIISSMLLLLMLLVVGVMLLLLLMVVVMVVVRMVVGCVVWIRAGRCPARRVVPTTAWAAARRAR